ncbi:MAG: transglycosylase SLT domain-containing protein, partial [Nanoarchaeota archaeon]
IEAESTFNPNAPGGGLMQVKSFDENYEAMLKQNTDLNSLKLLNDVNNPTANIYVGTYKFLKLKGYLTGCVDLGCQIAAYNVGHTPINAAAQLITSPGSTPSWNAVYAQLQSNSNILVQSSSKWTAESAQERIKNLGPYVNTIIAQV